MVATLTETFISAPIDQFILINELTLAAADAGLGNPVDNYSTGTDRFLVFEISQDASKLYGSVALRWQIRADLRIYVELFSTWDISAHSGTNSSGNFYQSDLSGTEGITVVAINGGAEYQFVIISQGSNRISLGGISPFQKPGWWDLNSWGYYFTPDYADFRRFRTTGLNPYGSVYHEASLNNQRMGSGNDYTGRRDILKGLLFFSQRNKGVGGKTSSDLASCAADGTNFLDVIDVPGTTEQYKILHPGSGGLAVQVST